MTTEQLFHIHHLIEGHARKRPEAIAIIDADNSAFTYAQYQAAIVEAVALLRERDTQQGDRVLIVAENCAVTAVFIFAASAVGAFAVPVNARMTAAEMSQVVDHATPRVAVYTTGVSEDAGRHANAAQAIDHETGFGRFAISVIERNNVVNSNTASGKSSSEEAEGTAVILYTTGTTGDPKGVMLTHANLYFAAQASSGLRSIKPDDCIYGALPLTHVFGLASMLIAASFVGASVQLEVRFRPDRVYAALMNGVTVFPGVPQMHALVMQYVSTQGHTRLENSRLRYVSSGAAPLDPAWKRKAEAFYGLALQNGYGMTESTAGVCATSNPIGTADTSVGPALPGMQIRLDTSVGSSGDTDTGEILTRGPQVMKGYFRNPEETAKAIDADGWLRTGDLGKIDNEGNLHVVGRCKELIIRGGFNVYPPEVEAALNDHPDVIQAAVIGRTLDNGNEEILAFVQGVDPDVLDAEVLAAFVSERLVSYKRPSQIITCAELPIAATGKILKHRLLSTFALQLLETDKAQ